MPKDLEKTGNCMETKVGALRDEKVESVYRIPFLFISKHTGSKEIGIPQEVSLYISSRARLLTPCLCHLYKTVALGYKLSCRKQILSTPG